MTPPFDPLAGGIPDFAKLYDFDDSVLDDDTGVELKMLLRVESVQALFNGYDFIPVNKTKLKKTI